VREESVLTVALQLRADLLILSWSGVLEANRARTVRSICAVAPCPGAVGDWPPPRLNRKVDRRGGRGVGS
jgi:hypothetical protein